MFSGLLISLRIAWASPRNPSHDSPFLWRSGTPILYILGRSCGLLVHSPGSSRFTFSREEARENGFTGERRGDAFNRSIAKKSAASPQNVHHFEMRVSQGRNATFPVFFPLVLPTASPTIFLFDFHPPSNT